MWGAQRRAALLRPRRALPVPPFTFVNSEAQAFVARISATPSAVFKAAYDTLFGRLKAGRLNGSNLLTAFDVFYVRAAPSSQAALLNLMGTSFTATLSTNAPTFHAGYGFTSNGIDSYVEWGGWRPVDGVQYQRNSASFGFWARNPSTSPATNPQAGAITGSPWATTRNSSGGSNYRINDGTNSNAAASGVTDGSGLAIAVRPDASTKRLYRGAAQLGADAAVASTTPGSAVVREGNAFAAFAQDQLPFAFAGRALTANEVADLHDALSEYLTAIGWQPLFVAPTTEATIRAAATTLPAYTARVTLPDAVPTVVTGKGFTCTGAARAPDGTWWVCAFGRNVQGDASSTSLPYIVHLDTDRATTLGTINLVALGAPASGVQGIAYDPTDGTLFVAYGLGSIYHVAADTVTPALIGSPITGLTGLNGLAYDSARDKLVWAGPLTYLNKDGSSTGLPSIRGTVPGNLSDQITYCADLDAFLVSGGANGSDGLIFRIGMKDQNYAALRVSAIYLAPGMTAIEGIVRDPSTKVATVFNDWWYHGSSGALANGSALVQMPV